MQPIDRRRAAGWTLAAAALAAAGWLAALTLSPPAEAQVGGYSEVTGLEVMYQLGDGTTEARFHLASGIALSQKLEPAAADQLLRAAGVFAEQRTRMFVTAQDDRVVAWTLSVP